MSTICSSPPVLAQQLTHIELERLSHIGPEEFVQVIAIWMIGIIIDTVLFCVDRNINMSRV